MTAPRRPLPFDVFMCGLNSSALISPNTTAAVMPAAVRVTPPTNAPISPYRFTPSMAPMASE